MPGKKQQRGQQVDLSTWTSFRPPPLSSSIVLPPPSPPHQSTAAAAASGALASLSSLPPAFPALGGDAATQSGGTGSSNGGGAQQPQRHGNNNNNNNNNNVHSSKTSAHHDQHQHKMLLHHTTNKEAALTQKKSHRRAVTTASTSTSTPAVVYASAGSTASGKLSERLLYVLNTYQFVVGPSALIPQVNFDILRAMASFDEFPCWSHICAVVLRDDFANFSCSICLSVPCAPRMALCGHVFCSACWVQYTNERAALAVRQGKDPNIAAAMVPCPVCSTMTPASITKPVLFVPRICSSASGGSDGKNSSTSINNSGEVEFTRLQRLRTAPVFFKPVSGSQVRGTSPEGTPCLGPQQASSSSMLGEPSTSSIAGHFPLLNPEDSNNIGAAAAAAAASASAGEREATAATPAIPATPTTSVSLPSSGTASVPSAALSSLLPRLHLDGSDDVTTCSRYLAFDPAVLQKWASQQLRSLELEKEETAGNIAAAIAACGPDRSAAAHHPMVIALTAQLDALEAAMSQLLGEMSLAASAPAMPPPHVGFNFAIHSPSFPAVFKNLRFEENSSSSPASVSFVLKKVSAAVDVVDMYRGVCDMAGNHYHLPEGSKSSNNSNNYGGASSNVQIMFLHPMTVKMLQEDAASRGQPPPDTVRCLIDDVEPIAQTPEQRKRSAFSHIPLGATFYVAFSDLTKHHAIGGKAMLPHVAQTFLQAVEDRREKIRRFLVREAEQAARQEKYAAQIEKVNADRTRDMVMQFSVTRDPANSTSLLDDEEIARRNQTAFASGLDDGSNNNNNNSAGGGKKKASNKRQEEIEAAHRDLPSLSACWSSTKTDDDDDGNTANSSGIAAAHQNSRNANDVSLTSPVGRNSVLSSSSSSGLIILSPHSAVLSAGGGSASTSKVLDLSGLSSRNSGKGTTSSAAAAASAWSKPQQKATPPQSPPVWSSKPLLAASAASSSAPPQQQQQPAAAGRAWAKKK